MEKGKIDTTFLGFVCLLVFIGFFIFLSASLGLLTRGGGLSQALISNQLIGILLGFFALFIFANIHYSFWKKVSIYLFVLATILNLAVFIPGLGIEHGGATRWLALGTFSFQPAEVFKFAFVVFFAAWATTFKEKINTLRAGIMPLALMLGLIGLILFFQRDAGTFLVISLTAIGMYIAAGAKIRNILAFAGTAGVVLWILAIIRPYIRERLITFIDSAVDPLGGGWQIQQSLIAIGSGDIFGRGFGKSIQKFEFLPEPVGDSIFAVAAEEWGFVGALVIITLFLLLALRGFKIASQAPDMFARLLTVGVIILIIAQSFINMGAMLGVFPLTGMPLIFISHGGTAMLLILAQIGIVLNISRYQKEK